MAVGKAATTSAAGRRKPPLLLCCCYCTLQSLTLLNMKMKSMFLLLLFCWWWWWLMILIEKIITMMIASLLQGGNFMKSWPGSVTNVIQRRRHYDYPRQLHRETLMSEFRFWTPICHSRSFSNFKSKGRPSNYSKMKSDNLPVFFLQRDFWETP